MKYFYFLITIFFTTGAFAQYNTGGLGEPIQGVGKIEFQKDEQFVEGLRSEPLDVLTADALGIIDPIDISDVNYSGASKGKFEVSLMGEATYNLPIAVPPGINGVVPEIALAFNSQASNGIAGYGWDISGLSAISKVGSNKFFDGKNSVINYSSDDRFIFDGQRLLLKSGVYGMDGAEYQTETYSNLKITSHGTSQPNYGPEYFKVQFPNGNIAYYGRQYTGLGGSSTRTNTVYALTYVTNPQNIIIKYTYINDNGNLLISGISYGYRSTNPLSDLRLRNTDNYISFIYKERNRAETGYVFNEATKLTKILDKITVKGYAENYRTYQLTYRIGTLGYEQLQKVTETSGDGTLNKQPVLFSYGSDVTGTNLVTEEIFDAKDQYGVGFGGLSSQNTKLISGNFSGQGRIGFLMHFTSTDGNQYTDGNNLYMYNPSNPNNPDEPIILKQNFGSTPFTEVVTSKRLTADNTLLPNEGWTTITKTAVVGNATTYQFKSFIYMPSTANSIYSIGNAQSAIMYGNAEVRRQFLSGDFNGDGITEIVRMEHSSNFKNSSYNQYSSGIDIFDTTTNTVYATPSIPIGFNYFVVDTDGDGYDEFVVIRYQNIRVYKFNQITKFLELYSDEYTPDITGERPVYLGDFNGDGKLDFITPAGNNSTNWVFYINKDNGQYNHFLKNIGVLYETGSVTANTILTIDLKEHNFVLTDINNDGKTDILKTTDHFRVSKLNGSQVPLQNTQIWTCENIGFDAANQSVSFRIPLSPQQMGTPVNMNPLIAFTNYNKDSYKTELSFITGNKLRILKSKKDHVLTQQLKTIDEYDITTRITYDVYDEKKKSDIEDAVVPFASFGENLPVYPKVEMDVVPGLYLVKKVTYDNAKGFILGNSTTERKQLFTYGDAMISHNGKGFLGFKGTMSTNIYRGGPTIFDLQDQVKYVKKYDLDNNAIIKEELVAHDINWVNFFTDPFNFMSKQVNTYSITNLPNKVFKAQNTQSVLNDGLKNIQSIITLTYDNYVNPLSVVKTVTGGGETATSSTTFTYIHNLTNDNYYIGRPASKTVKMNNVQITKENYTYNNHLLITVSKNGADSTSEVAEFNEYDIFGNIIKKTLGGSDISLREASSIYDSTGRYIEKSIDIEGLETTYVYNKNKGWLMSQTNPYGLTTSFGYNPFGMIVSETDYLGNNTTFDYKTKSPNLIGPSFVRKETNYADGRKEKVTTNGWNNKISEAHTNIEGNWVNTSYTYDSQDRLIKKSDPYFTTASLFTNFTYDEYGRIIKTVMPTGKEINSSYDGLATTVDDGTKIKTETLNINGQLKKVVDNGETINYTYNTNGSLKSTNYSGAIVSFEYDIWGRKSKISDPSAGTFLYQYNSVGELLKETSPNGTMINTYDDKGRLLATTYPDTTIDYYYDSQKMLEKIIVNGTKGLYREMFTYDNYKRLIKKQHIIPLGGFNYIYDYTFDNLGRVLTEQKHVSGFVGSDVVKTKNIYKNGYLWKLQNVANNADLKIYNSINEREQVTNFTLGNGLTTEHTYDQYGYLTQNTVYKNNAQFFMLNNTWNVQEGNLTARSNTLFTGGINETFKYDSFDRLIQNSTKQGTAIIAQENNTYDAKGRILNNNVGDYSYDSAKPYQVQKIENLNDLAYYQDNPLQQITYNALKAPLTIKQQGKENIYFHYNGLNDRMVMYYGNEAATENNSSKVRYYSPKKDIEVDWDIATNKYIINIFVDGDAYNATILQRKENNVTTLNYLHRDYLGSIVAITNNAANIVEKRHFDAWGNTLLVQDGQNNNLNKLTFLERGYTGHEHLQGVGLINMNARLYDAKLHRFLAPDNFIQDASNPQNYNRYGYVLNNPLKYNDQSGEFIFSAITAVFNAIKEFIQHGVNFGDYNWHQTRMAWKIDAGMFKGNFGQLLAKWSPWSIVNSIVGNVVSHAFNLAGNVKDVTYLDGAIALDTTRDNNAFTIGGYINGPRGFKADYHDHLFAHEYGHFIQSAMFGPFYLPVIGLPSMASNDSTHENRWYEVHASRLGGKYFKNHYADFEYDVFKNGGITTYINPRKGIHEQGSNSTTGGIIKFWDIALPVLALTFFPYLL